jgi:Flp pilus assembly protein TadG
MDAATFRRGSALRDERGQMAVVVVLMLGSLIAMAALVLDVGFWLRDQRHLQSVADASALAGAQALPYDPGTATSLAISYATSKNNGPTPSIVFPTPNSISVDVQRPVLRAQLSGDAEREQRHDARRRSDGPHRPDRERLGDRSADH